MKNIKDKKIIALTSILVLFTIIYFVAVGRISYAFDLNSNSKESYNSLIDTIKECAKKYAINNDGLFGEENTIYLKVQDLIDAGFLAPNSGENLVSPIDNQTSLNYSTIKIKKDNNNYIIDIESSK